MQQGMKGHSAGKLTLAIGLTIAFGRPAVAQQSPAQELLRQQERERALQEQQDTTPDVRLARPVESAPDRIPNNETPCFPIVSLRLDGEHSMAFQWALHAANLPDDPATGRCLGSAGVAIVMKRVQNAIVAWGRRISRTHRSLRQTHARG
jgi:hemolysin activation/secretion protein